MTKIKVNIDTTSATSEILGFFIAFSPPFVDCKTIICQHKTFVNSFC